MQEIPLIANNIYEKMAPPGGVISKYINDAQNTPPYIGIIIGVTLGILIVLITYARFPRNKLTDDDIKEIKEKGLTYFAGAEEVESIKKTGSIELIQPRFLVHREYLPLILGSPDDMSKKFIKSRMRREDPTQDIYTVYISKIGDTQMKNLRVQRRKSAVFVAQYIDPFHFNPRNKVTYNCIYQAKKENPNEKKKHRFNNNRSGNGITGRLRIRKEK